MKTRLILTAVMVAGVMSGSPAQAQKEKSADVGGVSFISGPKGDRPRVPGLNAALLLSPDQKLQLAAAYDETLRSEALQEAGRKVKTNPQASEADREAVRVLKEQAQADFDRRVSQILSAPQKELIQRFNVLYGQSVEATGTEFRQKLVDAKGDKALTEQLRNQQREMLNADFARRVSEILTVEQRGAFDRAVAEDIARADNPKKKKK